MTNRSIQLWLELSFFFLFFVWFCNSLWGWACAAHHLESTKKKKEKLRLKIMSQPKGTFLQQKFGFPYFLFIISDSLAVIWNSRLWPFPLQSKWRLKIKNKDKIVHYLTCQSTSCCFKSSNFDRKSSNFPFLKIKTFKESQNSFVFCFSFWIFHQIFARTGKSTSKKFIRI